MRLEFVVYRQEIELKALEEWCAVKCTFRKMFLFLIMQR